MRKNVILTLVLLLMSMLLKAQTPCPNAVVNGDFEAGNTGFTSSLASSCECVANSFCVNTNFNLKCPGWPNFGNHTSGGSNFMLIDGSDVAATNVWSTTVPVSPGDTYTFSFWVASAYTTSQQVFDLGMEVNGVIVKQFTISQVRPNWTQYTFSGVCPPNLRSMPIAIRQMSADGFRDFGLDDIYFACCPCKADYTTTSLDNCRNIQFNNISTGSGVTYAWSFGDSASGVNNTSSLANPTHLFSKCGSYEVCLTLSGGSCSSKICYKVEVTDNIPPQIACPRNLTVNTNAGQCFYTGTLPQPSVSDNCAKAPEIICTLLTPTSSILITPQTQFPKGVNTISCIARDECGNTSRACTYTLTVKDNQAPVITCPISMSVLGVKDAQGRCKALISGQAPTVTDNCPMTTLTYAVTGATTATGSNNLTEVNFMEGLSTVTYTAVDMDGNKATCSFTITVRCPCEAGFTFANLNDCGNVQFTNTSTGTAPLTYAWNFGDPNSGTANTSTLQNPSHQFSKCGTYEVCLTITGNGCSSKVCKTVVIKDDQAPKIVCPSTVTVSTNPGQCYFSGKFTQPKVTDNCDQAPELICSWLAPTSSILISPETQFPKGEHIISCIVVDACGNGSEPCNYTLIVVDKEPPVITCPANVTVQGTLNADGLCKAVVRGIAPKASDNCPMLGVNWKLSGATIGQGVADASGTNFMQGVTTVTYTALDMAGNSVTCSFTVTVNCPCQAGFNITYLNDCGNVQFTNTSTGTAPLTYVWNFGDPGSGTANTSTLQNPSHQFSKCDTFEVCLTITGNGCSSKVCKTVVVKDNQVPKIVCPPNVTVSTNPGQCYFSGKLVDPKATDNCDKDLEIICRIFAPNRPITINAQTQFPKGEHLITCFAVDDCGNVSETCTYILTVVDKELPIITCPANVTVQGTLNPEGLCKAVVKNIAPKASDNCPMLGVNWRLSGATIGQGIADASGTNFMQGVTTVTYTAVDMAGNSASCSFTVTVECKEVGELNIACGMAVATCFSGLKSILQQGNIVLTVDQNAPVIALFDVRDASNPSITVGDNWAAPKQMFLEGDALNCGQVFGLAIDKFGSIFTTASTIYGNASNIPGFAWGPGGPGAIYRFTYTNGAWVWSLFKSLPNGGSGLGNITYDKDNDQFFVTNFHDGLIYRIPNNSTPPTTYLHNGTTTFPSTHADFVPLGKRLWGIGYNPVDKKVYFARWNEDAKSGRYNPSTFNEIRSIELLNGDFKPNSEQHEFWLPNFSFTGQSFSRSFSNPVSDIEFSENGDMLIAEKTMLADIGFATNPSPGGWAHQARILQYKGVSGAWGPPQLIHIGNGEAFSGSHNNSAGGVDYGYEGLDTNGNLTGCDSLVWGSGDALMYPGDNQFNGSPNRVYGIAAMPVAGNTPTPPISTWVESTSIYVDLDGNLSNLEKLQIGDVDIFNCACPAKAIFPCDSLEVSYSPVTSSGEKKCCYSVDLTNQVTTQGLTKICANLNTPGWIFNTGALLAVGWVWDQTGTNQLCFKPQSGNIPAGQLQDILTFCLTANNPNAPTTQQIVFEWYAGNNIVCKDTIRTECSSIAAQDTCVVISNLKVKCLGENDLEYCMTFDATNLNNTDVYGLILGSLPAGYSYADCGCGGSAYGSGGYLFSGFPLIPANSTKSFCVKIIASSPVLSPTKICFNTTLEFATKCCSSPKDWCVELKPCCDPCEQTFVTVKQNGADSCCYSLDFNYNCDFRFYSRIDFDILTPGVSFGWHTNDLNWDLYTIPTLTNVSIKPDLGAVQPGTIKDLFSFCLKDINQPSANPQQVKVTYWTTGSNGKDSMACDTILNFNCTYKKDTCLFVTNEEIRCIPDSMKYEITVTVQNLSVPNFTASYLGILAPGITPNPIPLSPAIGYGASQTVTFCYTPTTWPDPDGKLILIYRLKHAQSDSCCNGGQVLMDTLMLPSCDSCQCGTFSDLTFRPARGAPNMPIKCGDTLGVSCNPQFNPIIAGNFQCVGECAADSVHWELFSLSPKLLVASGNVSSGNFNLAILAAYFSTPGFYELTLSSKCGKQTCPPCKFIIKATGCPCCEDLDVFCQSMLNHIEIKIDSAKCKATLAICNIRACDYIQSINWGDSNTSTGPFTAGAMPMHTYTGSGTYIISYLAVEVNPVTGKICFEKEFRDTIVLNCDSICKCGGFSDLSFRFARGAPNIAVKCGDTIGVSCNPGFDPVISGNFQCIGGCAADSVHWELFSLTSNLFVASGDVSGPNFSIALLAAYFSTPGTYTLTLSGQCGGKSCPPCKIIIKAKGCPCCADFDVFCQSVMNHIEIKLDGTKCKATLTVCNIRECDYLESISWGDGSNSAGPFGPGAMSMHTYAKSGTYIISYLAIEKDPITGKICFEKRISDTITIVCKDCACKGAENLYFGGLQGAKTIGATCGSTTPVELPCSAAGAFFFFHGDVYCDGDSCLGDEIGWSIGQGDFKILSGSMPISYIILGGNQGHFDLNNLDPAMFAPGVVYTLNINWTCGGKACSCRVRFVFKGCPDCACGKFTEVFLRPNSGPSIALSCGDKGPLVPCPVVGQPFNFTGSFACQGDNCPKTTPVKWTLLDPSGGTVATGSVTAMPNFSINLSPALFSKKGEYTLKLEGYCGAKLCECLIKFRLEAPCPSSDCVCGTYSGMFIRSGQRPSIPVVCGCNPVPVGCPPNGQNLVLTGQFQCQGQKCPEMTEMDWVLIGPNGPLPIASGTSVIANPNFSINIDPSLLTQAGVYTLKLIGHCGKLECPCVISFIMDPPCPKDSCTCGTYDLLVKIGKANLQVRCGDTIDVPNNFDFYGSFECVGNGCPILPGVHMAWTLSGPPGFIEESSHDIMKPDILIPSLIPANLTIPGLYTLTLVALCGGDSCPCTIYFRVSDYCCKDADVFLQNAKSVQTNAELGDCIIKVQTTSLTGCMRIRYDWGDGKFSGIITSNNVPITHTYAAAGIYVVCYTIEELNNGLVCQRYTHCDTIEVKCRCNCGTFEQVKLVNKKLGTTGVLNCDTKVLRILPCPPVGKPYIITGKLVCNPTDCKGSNLHWELKDSINTVVASGNQAGPWFSIPLDYSLLSKLKGNYRLVLTGMCGSKTCSCSYFFQFTSCPPTCPCDDAFTQSVQAGFNWGWAGNGNCAFAFTPKGILDCDKVSWTISGTNNLTNTPLVYTGTTLNNQTFTQVFPNGILGNFLITMTVSHIGPDGKPCERKFTQIVNINCILVGAAPTCNDNMIINPGFNQNSMPGILGRTGKTNAWVRQAGMPNLVDDAGFADRYSILLSGKCFGVIDVISNPVVLGPKRIGRVSFAYKALAEDLRPGTHLVLRLSDNPLTDLACKDGCVEIARMPINATDGKWGNMSTTFSLNGLEGKKLLSLHVENDLAYEDPDANSKVSIDNLCFVQLESLTTDTRDLLSNRVPIRIFPNPNPGNFTVELPKPATTGMSLRVTDLAGRLVLEKSTEVGNPQQSIQAEYLSAGMYFLQVVEKGRVVGMEKFVKQ